MEAFKSCNLCPRECGVDRTKSYGFCNSPANPVVNVALLHHGEEPPISGDPASSSGSGTVFFEGCSLRCPFCQNYVISNKLTGKGQELSPEELADVYLKLQDDKAYNINLVTPMHYAPSVSKSLVIARNNGLKIPVAINTGGYESVNTLRLFDGLVDIYMPDFKFWSSKLSSQIINAPDYKDRAIESLNEMYRQVGSITLDSETGLMKKGMIVRHLMMPGQLFDTKKILDYLTYEFGNNIYISLMSQYTPMPQLQTLKDNGRIIPDFLLRKVPHNHYESACDYLGSLDQENAFVQDESSSGDEMIPPFKF